MMVLGAARFRVAKFRRFYSLFIFSLSRRGSARSMAQSTRVCAGHVGISELDRSSKSFLEMPLGDESRTSKSILFLKERVLSL